MKLDQMPSIIYADRESLIKDLEKSLTTKTGAHLPWGCSMATILALDAIENKHSYIVGKIVCKSFVVPKYNMMQM